MGEERPSIDYRDFARQHGAAVVLPVMIRDASDTLTLYVPAWIPAERYQAFADDLASHWSGVSPAIILVHDVPMERLSVEWWAHFGRGEVFLDG